jgi:hypothetical protein
LGLVLIPFKNNMMTKRISKSINISGRLAAGGISMNSHAAEVLPEARLKESTSCRIQWLAWR